MKLDYSSPPIDGAMPRQRTSRLTWIVTLLIAGGILAMGWALFRLHVTEPRGPVSASEAHAFASISIPAEAKSIRIAGYGQWIEGARFLRFEAPVAICLQAAKSIVTDEKLEPVDPWELRSFHEPARQGVFRDLSWFDLQKATNVVAAGGGSSKPRVWVDQDRGVLYYRWTD